MIHVYTSDDIVFLEYDPFSTPFAMPLIGEGNTFADALRDLAIQVEDYEKEYNVEIEAIGNVW